MAENIFRVYEGGDWNNESESSRFSHIVTALGRYATHDYDWLDLQWHIKNAVIGNIFFSEEVYDGVLSGVFWHGYLASKCKHAVWIDRILKGDTLLPSGIVDESLLQIRERLNRKSSGGELRFEHMVPAKIYLNHLFQKYQSGTLDLAYFREFRKRINVCIVTKQEDAALPRDRMPDNWNLDVDAPNERYVRAGLAIHNWP